MTPFLEARNLHKYFSGVHALDEVSASFFPGEIVSVMGENGAGKSTLMKVIAGVHTPEQGVLLCEGQVVSIPHVRRAAELGIAFIHQELNLADNLTVADNIFLGREPRVLGFLNQRAMREQARLLLTNLGVSFGPDTLVSELSIGHQQMVEIAKALSQNAKMLIMDEPTSSLSQRETERLFILVKQLREKGLCVVFISHRMVEVMELSDRVIVLRDGKNSGEIPERSAITREKIVHLMVGRDLHLPEKTHSPAKEVLLEVKNLSTQRFPQEKVSFQLRAGEVVGVAGLVGAGRTELARTLFGIDARQAGEVILAGKPLKINSPRDAMRAGIALVPEDRKQQGVFLEMAIRDNMVACCLPSFQFAGFMRDGAINQNARIQRERLQVRTTDIFKPVGQLSGGNQQKVAIAKWLPLAPKVFILDEPTRGVDVGAKSEIYQVIETMAREGAAVLMISSELEELLRVADRVLVMHEGRLTADLSREELSEERIMRHATGTAV
jgi:ribose transport system ATP-binding protein